MRKLGPNKRLEYMKTVVLQKKRKPKESASSLDTDLSKKIQIESDSLFSENSFNELEICAPLQESLKVMNLDKMTMVQSQSIPPALKGHDILASAKTGSGKTLAFLLPALNLLYKANFRREQGIGVLILSPTRELAIQIHTVVSELMQHMSQSHGLVIGGTSTKTESFKLSKHVNVLVATPGRLLDHLLNTSLVIKNLMCLIIDEADAILKQGFEQEVNQILGHIPVNRQTLLFSATQTKKVEDLSRVSLKDPVAIGIRSTYGPSTVSSLEQGYVVVPPDKKFLLLFTFLKKHLNEKVMVFFSSCNSVKFHCDLLNYVDVPVMDIHGKQKQQKRTTTFFEFSKKKEAILLCTDVAARGLDIPAVDWIIQFDPPDMPEEYIHRVGRTARVESKGKALLLLLPEELGFLRYLKHAQVPLNEFEFAENKLANIQAQYDRLIEKNYYLHKAARDAYKSYLLAYASHQHKNIFDVASLDLQKVARSFGLSAPPFVNLNVKLSKHKKNEKKYYVKTGHTFSNRNPDGKKPEGDQRQFAR